MTPLTAMICSTPTEAEALWIITVKITPTSTPSKGLERFATILINHSSCAIGLIAVLMVDNPTKRIPRLATTCPKLLMLLDFANIKKATPTKAITGAYFEI